MATTTPRPRRSPADWETLARELLPELQDGKSFADLEERIGANTDALRTALAQLGYNPHGEPMKLREIAARTPRTLARRVALRRLDGAPWWLISAETGKSYSELTGLLASQGYATTGEALGNGGDPVD